MPPRHVNIILYKNNPIGREIRLQDGELQNRATIIDFIQRQFSVDITNVPYTLWFFDYLGNQIQLEPLHTIKSAFDAARAGLNGRRYVCLHLWHHQRDSKPSNWTFEGAKIKVKEEDC